MDINLNDNHAAITLPEHEITIEVNLTIDNRAVRVDGYAQPKNGWMDVKFTAWPGTCWEVHNGHEMYEENRSPEARATLRTVLTAIFVAVDQWYTPERVAQARVTAAEAAVAAAEAEAARAEAELANARATLEKARAGS